MKVTYVGRRRISSNFSTVYALNVIDPIDPLVALYIVQVVLVRSTDAGPTLIVFVWLSLPVAFVLVSLLPHEVYVTASVLLLQIYSRSSNYTT